MFLLCFVKIENSTLVCLGVNLAPGKILHSPSKTVEVLRVRIQWSSFLMIEKFNGQIGIRYSTAGAGFNPHM